MQIGGPHRFALIWSADAPFVYEGLHGGAEHAPLGRGGARFATLAQALAMGKRLEAGLPSISYGVFVLEDDGTMRLKGSFPKRVNAEGAVIRFRRRAPRTGGADDSRLGVGGMGDDVWRELMQQDAMGDIDFAWSAFRKSVLELGSELEVLDAEGNPVDFGADVDDDEPIYD